MNAPYRPPRAPTRHKITRAEYRAMLAAGVFPPEMALELIDGALIEMPADGARTIDWNAVIVAWLIRSLDERYLVVPDKSLVVSETSEPKPDIWIFEARLRTEDVTAADTLLVIEVADATLAADLRKAEIYAQGGVREYWVMDVAKRVVLVHRLRPDGGYGEPEPYAADAPVQPLLLPQLSFRIADHPRLMQD